MWLLVCIEVVESILVKLETSRTVILPPTVSVLCSKIPSFLCSSYSFGFFHDKHFKHFKTIFLETYFSSSQTLTPTRLFSAITLQLIDSIKF